MSCGVVSSATVVPELQHYFYDVVTGPICKINKWRVPSPVDINELFLKPNSFIEMLFNDNYSGTSYEYRYRNETNLLCWPPCVLRRIKVYTGAAKYLVLDSEGNNVFNLQPDDFTLLDALLQYRIDSTSVTIVDTTGVAIFDSTSNILYARYGNLSTELSQMIYLYLDLKIYERYQSYNNLNLVSSGGVLQSCYEQYLIDQYFCFMTERVPDLIYVPEAPEVGTC